MHGEDFMKEHANLEHTLPMLGDCCMQVLVGVKEGCCQGKDQKPDKRCRAYDDRVPFSTPASSVYM